jgi:hypothetical protein
VEIVTGKLTAIAHAIVNPIHFGTGQNRTGAAQQPLLGGQFPFSLRALSRSATGTGSQQIQFAHITVDAAGSCWHNSTSLILRNAL